MMDTAAYLADTWVAICAALGAVVVLLHIGDLVQRPEIARRFRFCLWVLIGLMLARVGHWDGWGWLFSAVANCCAALVPLAALVLAEGLLRRHAPPLLKQTCAWGALGLSVMGLIQFSSLEPVRLSALLLFQLIALSGVALFVWRRDRASLSPTENRTINRIGLSFVLILPFLATDYMRETVIDAPVKLGGVAVLVLCWLAIGMNRPGLRAADILRSFGIVFLVTVLVTLILSALVSLDLRTGAQVTAIVVSALILLAIWQAAVALRIEDRQLIALREIAEAQGQGAEAGLALLRRAAGAPDAMLLTEADLSDMELDALRSSFAALPVQHLGAAQDEQINWLFSRYDATHAVRLSDHPMMIVLLSSPAIAGQDSTGAALRAVQRMAQLMAAEGRT